MTWSIYFAPPSVTCPLLCIGSGQTSFFCDTSICETPSSKTPSKCWCLPAVHHSLCFLERQCGIAPAIPTALRESQRSMPAYIYRPAWIVRLYMYNYSWYTMQWWLKYHACRVTVWALTLQAVKACRESSLLEQPCMHEVESIEEVVDNMHVLIIGNIIAHAWRCIDSICAYEIDNFRQHHKTNAACIIIY